MCCPRIYDKTCEFDYWGFIIGVFGLLTAILLGFQILQSVNFEGKVNKFNEQINDEQIKFYQKIEKDYKKFNNKINQRIGECIARINKEYQQKTIEINTIKNDIQDIANKVNKDYDEIQKTKKRIQQIQSILKKQATAFVDEYRSTCCGLSNIYFDVYEQFKKSQFLSDCLYWGLQAAHLSYLAGKTSSSKSMLNELLTKIPKFEEIECTEEDKNDMVHCLTHIKGLEQDSQYQEFMEKIQHVTIVKGKYNDEKHYE